MKFFLVSAANGECRTPKAKGRTQRRALLHSMFGVYIYLLVVLVLVSCVNTAPPVVTSEMAERSTRENITVAQLQHGRRLFASRCIECHTLPPVNAHDRSEWPCLVSWMAERASLKPEEREAVVAYILAARAHTSDSN